MNCVQVVLAAKGYPGNYTKGTLIRNLDSVKDAKVCCLPLSEPPATYVRACKVSEGATGHLLCLKD